MSFVLDDKNGDENTGRDVSDPFLTNATMTEDQLSGNNEFGDFDNSRSSNRSDNILAMCLNIVTIHQV